MSTSITAHPKKNPHHHWRNDSGELDVFEAARYFSAANDQSPGKQQFQRLSLDMPMMRANPNIHPEYHHIMIMDHHHQSKAMESKKFKQPSSPGGRLASFLNSLFNQSHSKKKKKKTKPTARDLEDESPGGACRRKRRSSISHFLSSSDKKTSDANTPTKSYKINSSDHDQGVLSGPKNGGNYKITLLDELHADRLGSRGGYAWIEEKFRISNSDKMLKDSSNRDFREEDEGADSDSSSDLFDLPNHDLDFLSSGLPVYGTTHMDRINIAAPISGV